MSKNKPLIFFVISVVIVFAVIIYIYNNNELAQRQKSNDAQRLSTEIQTNEQQNNEDVQNKQPTETEITTFSTVLKDRTSGRINNIKIGKCIFFLTIH